MSQTQKGKEHPVPKEETNKAMEREPNDMMEEELTAMLNKLTEEVFNLLPKKSQEIMKRLQREQGMSISGVNNPWRTRKHKK